MLKNKKVIREDKLCHILMQSNQAFCLTCLICFDLSNHLARLRLRLDLDLDRRFLAPPERERERLRERDLLRDLLRERLRLRLRERVAAFLPLPRRDRRFLAPPVVAVVMFF